MLSVTCLGADEISGTDKPLAKSSIQVGNDRLSVTADGAAFEEVLAEVARQAGFEVTLTSVQSMGAVTDSFSNLPTIEGLRRLLGDRSHMLIFSEADGARHLVEVWIMSGESTAGNLRRTPILAGAVASETSGELANAQRHVLIDPDSFQPHVDRMKAEIIAGGGAVQDEDEPSDQIQPTLPGQAGIDPLSSVQHELTERIEALFRSGQRN